MLGSAMLETIIGVAFVFLTVSLAVTAANELLASVFRWRAADLEKGIGRLLGKNAGPADPAAKSTLLEEFKGHALIQSLTRKDTEFPSYIHPRTFAAVLLDLAKVPTGADKTAED